MSYLYQSAELDSPSGSKMEQESERTWSSRPTGVIILMMIKAAHKNFTRRPKSGS